MTKPFLSALAGTISERPPFWFMRQAGRYLPEYRALRKEAGSFLDLCYSPDQACEVTLQPLRRFEMDAAILFSDILVIPHALGQKLAYVQGEGPQLPPIRNRATFEELSLDHLHDVLNPVYQTVEKVSQSISQDQALIGFAGSPWTVACYMVEGQGSKEFHHVKQLGYQQPVLFEKLLELLVTATISYLDRQIQAGAETVQLFDSWAGVLSDQDFDRWVIEPTKEIVKQLREKHPTTPVIGFPRGAGVKYRKYVQETAVTAVAIDTMMPLDWVATNLQELVPIQGNLDPLHLLTGGAAMIERVNYIWSMLKNGPFIFNLGHGIIKETPPDHVEQLSNHLKSLG